MVSAEKEPVTFNTRLTSVVCAFSALIVIMDVDGASLDLSEVSSKVCDCVVFEEEEDGAASVEVSLTAHPQQNKPIKSDAINFFIIMSLRFLALF